MTVKSQKLGTIRTHTKGQSGSTSDGLERAKAYATIFSAVAIPIVLAAVGYFIQRQIVDDGLKKDYVSIATNILKEDPKKQEPELRAWAVEVLDNNSTIPFSKKAKAGLLTGLPVVVAGPAIPMPPDDCRQRPKERTVLKAAERILKFDEKLSSNQRYQLFVDFFEIAMKEEFNAKRDQNRLNCLQDFLNIIEQVDIDYRLSIGAPSSKSVFADLKSKNAASAASAASTKSPASRASSP